MRLLLATLLALTLVGCAGYQLGPTNGVNAGSRTVKIQPFVNRTQEPRVSECLSTSLRKQLQQDGTFRLETSGSPDIMVTGEIIRFLRNGLSYQPNDVLAPAEYTLELQARIVAVNVNTGKTFINRTVQSVTYIRIGNDEYSDERQALPILTDALARNAVSLLADGQW
jgi:hypothetical protein